MPKVNRKRFSRHLSLNCVASTLMNSCHRENRYYGGEMNSKLRPPFKTTWSWSRRLSQGSSLEWRSHHHLRSMICIAYHNPIIVEERQTPKPRFSSELGYGAFSPPLLKPITWECEIMTGVGSCLSCPVSKAPITPTAEHPTCRKSDVKVSSIGLQQACWEQGQNHWSWAGAGAQLRRQWVRNCTP